MKIPFQLEQAISCWRAELNASGSIGNADLAELESHLRDSYEELRKPPLADDEAFHMARRRLGGAEIVEELAKVDTEAVWAGRARWMILGVLLSQIFWSATKTAANLTAIITFLFTGGHDWSSKAAAFGYCLTSLLAMGLFVWVLVRLVRGNWSFTDTKIVSFLLHPTVLASLVCLLALLNTLALNYYAQILSQRDYGAQLSLLNYIGLAMLVAIPLILATALNMAQRRMRQIV